MENFQAILEDSFKSIQELNDYNQRLASKESLDTTVLNSIKKKFILDSVKLQRTFQQYKNWEIETKKNYINNDLVDYNKTVSEIAKANQKLDETTKVYEKLSSTLKLPEFAVNVKTIQASNNEKLIKISEKFINTEEPIENIRLNQLFALNSKNEDTELLFPDIDIIRNLINLELKQRIKSRVILEILTSIKSKLERGNRTWIQEDNNLKNFLDVKFKEVVERVEKIKDADSKAKEEEDEDDESEDERDEENRRNREVHEEEEDYVHEEQALIEESEAEDVDEEEAKQEEEVEEEMDVQEGEENEEPEEIKQSENTTISSELSELSDAPDDDDDDGMLLDS
ncbi:hypothetical protein KGF54_000123 [Candida jiufengensis]|uniref:uncharacterized protein n=1 Tax=Candida jiufengensis TaxID=497108 RepID=UPI00222423AF|nr:uncharacterized protein KGF54_000123 [Candida jiufengensis]KAI5957195.1 hypothetical protein KGF54_000123 [Candida jiufengensis]